MMGDKNMFLSGPQQLGDVYIIRTATYIWAVFKIPLLFRYTAWLIGIPRDVLGLLQSPIYKG